MLLRGVGFEVGAHEAHDLVFVEHDALPRRGRVDDGDAVAHGSEELLLTGLERERVDRDDGGCRQLSSRSSS